MQFFLCHATNWAVFERAYPNEDKANVPYNAEIIFESMKMMLIF
jgi:hypothetical protein